MKIVREILRVMTYCAIALLVAGMFHYLAKALE